MYIKVPIVIDHILNECNLEVFITALKKRFNISNRIYLGNNTIFSYIHNINEQLTNLCGIIENIDYDNLRVTIKIIDTPSGKIVSKLVNACECKTLETIKYDDIYKDIDLYENVISLENFYIFPIYIVENNSKELNNIFISNLELRYKE